jgi:hypothetical protein
MYTTEQNKEIEKVMAVFHDYIQNTKYFDVLWSDKLGYLYLNGISDDRDHLCMAPVVLRDGESLCDEIVYHIANDVLESRGKSHDLYLCTEIEKKEIRKALSTYMNDLPEYQHLIDALFVEK